MTVNNICEGCLRISDSQKFVGKWGRSAIYKCRTLVQIPRILVSEVTKERVSDWHYLCLRGIQDRSGVMPARPNFILVSSLCVELVVTTAREPG